MNSDGEMDTTDGTYVSRRVASDPVFCDTSSFGNVDPVSDKTKYCWCGTSNDFTQYIA